MCRLEERNMLFKPIMKFCMFCIPLWIEASALICFFFFFSFFKDAGNKISNLIQNVCIIAF